MGDLGLRSFKGVGEKLKRGEVGGFVLFEKRHGPSHGSFSSFSLEKREMWELKTHSIARKFHHTQSTPRK